MALEHAFFSGAKWVVLNDGNVFVPRPTWNSILEATKSPKVLYISTPHVRLSQEQNPSWLNSNTKREELLAKSKIATEFQEGAFSFRHDAPARFKENLAYGEADKWQLLEQLCGSPKPDVKPAHPEKYQSCRSIHPAVIRMWPYPEKGAEKAITDADFRWHLRKEAVERFKNKIKQILKMKRSAKTTPSPATMVPMKAASQEKSVVLVKTDENVVKIPMAENVVKNMMAENQKALIVTADEQKHQQEQIAQAQQQEQVVKGQEKQLEENKKEDVIQIEQKKENLVLAMPPASELTNTPLDGQIPVPVTGIFHE